MLLSQLSYNNLSFMFLMMIVINGMLFSTCSTNQPETPLVCNTTPDSMFSLSTTLTWQEFNLATRNISLKNKKWVWTALITIRSKQALKLQQINLQWSGEKIKSMHASLYRKTRADQALIPIQEYLVCDGVWNATKQQFTFVLDEKIVAINEYYLLLSFPQVFSKKLRHGQFTLAKDEPLKLVNL